MARAAKRHEIPKVVGGFVAGFAVIVYELTERFDVMDA